MKKYPFISTFFFLRFTVKSFNYSSNYQGWQNGPGPTGRPASPSVNTWAGSKNSARQPETARPVKPAGPLGQPAGQNGPARGPYHLIKKTAHAHFFSIPPSHTLCTQTPHTLYDYVSSCRLFSALTSPPPTTFWFHFNFVAFWFHCRAVCVVIIFLFNKSLLLYS